jgi:hypothetical protein
MSLSDLISGAAGYYNQDEAAKAALELGQQSAQELSRLGTEVAGMAEFKPFTVTTGLGQTTTTPTGGIDVGLTPEQQALQTQLLGQAQGLFGQVGVDPSMAQADLYEQMRAVQRPEEERQRLALEERMLSQGRLGLQSSAYGGASPELLAQETARQEAMARANLSARQQAMGEQAQALTAASGLLGAGYTPQSQALEALRMGTGVAGFADIGRREGAEMFAKSGQAGIEALMQGAELAQALEATKRQSLTEALLGREPTIQEQLLANYLKVPVPQGDSGFLGGLFSSDGLLGGLFGGGGSGSSSDASGGYTSTSPVSTPIGQAIPSGINNLENLF